METRTGHFFEVTLSYNKTQADGGLKKICEVFAIDALSFSEAEAKIIKEAEAYHYDDYVVKAIKKANYNEMFFGDDDDDIKYYNATLSFITIDDKSDKEKRSNVNYLVMASNIKAAIRHIDEIMGKTMIDYESISVKESKVVDVFMHDDK